MPRPALPWRRGPASRRGRRGGPPTSPPKSTNEAGITPLTNREARAVV